MSVDAYLPCLVCGKTLRNVYDGADNQPEEGIEFRAYGQYGSTFWDSMHGEELVLNVCDSCLTKHKDRLGQHKRYVPVIGEGVGLCGKHWVDRPLVAYTGNPDDTTWHIEAEQLGHPMKDVEWFDNIENLRAASIEWSNRQ